MSRSGRPSALLPLRCQLYEIPNHDHLGKHVRCRGRSKLAVITRVWRTAQRPGRPSAYTVKYVKSGRVFPKTVARIWKFVSPLEMLAMVAE